MKRVVIEQKDDGSFTVTGTHSNMESLGMIEYAKATMLTNMIQPKAKAQEKSNDNSDDGTADRS
jgi:hypothetical protein